MRRISALLITFLISAVLLNAQGITELEKLFEEENLSQEEIIEKAEEMGYTEEEIGQAFEKEGEEKGWKREEELRKEMERRKKTLEEMQKKEAAVKEKEKVSPPEEKELRPFGYDIFNLTPRTFQPLEIGPVPPDYPMSPGDEIIISLWGEVNVSHSLFVDREGKIFISDVGRVIVNGLTLEELKKKIKNKLASAYSGIRENKTFVDISLGKLQKIKVFIVGEVVRPGGYTVSGVSTVFNALYYAGGPTPKGSLRSVKLISPSGEEKVVDLYDYLIAGERKNDPRLHNNYTVFVPPAGKQVRLEGSVHRPAIYELKDDEGIKELLKIAGGLEYDAYRQRVQINRMTEDTIRKIININLDEIQKTDNDFILEDGDRVDVFSFLNREGCDSVFVYGEVKEPGGYELSSGMSLKNLILNSGGLTLPVHKLQAEISRLIPEAEADSAKVIPMNLEDAYSRFGEEGDTFKLEDQDVVFIRVKPEWKKQRRVIVRGEVEKPGEYPILSEDERLSGLIKRAGGLEKTAYPEAAKFIRRENNIGKIDVDLLGALESPGGEDDIVLEDRDEIFIPRELRTVKVTGEVMFPVSFSYEPGKNVSYYISKAGGCTEEANTDRIRLVLPNGKAKDPKSFLWFDVSGVPAGSEIVVPRAKETGGIDWTEIIKNTSSVVSSVVMVIFVVDRLQE